MTHVFFAGMIGGWELVLILAVVLILFGAKKLPELARGLGQGIKEFKKASNDITTEFQRSMDEPPPQQRQIPPQPRPEQTVAASSEPQKTAAPAPPKA